MLLKSGAVLLVAWLVVAFALPDIGDARHLLLLFGLMLLFLGFLRARDAAIAAGRQSNDQTGKV